MGEIRAPTIGKDELENNIFKHFVEFATLQVLSSLPYLPLAPQHSGI